MVLLTQQIFTTFFVIPKRNQMQKVNGADNINLSQTKQLNRKKKLVISFQQQCVQQKNNIGFVNTIPAGLYIPPSPMDQ